MRGAVISELGGIAPVYRDFLGSYHNGEVARVGDGVVICIAAFQEQFRLIGVGIANLSGDYRRSFHTLNHSVKGYRDIRLDFISRILNGEYIVHHLGAHIRDACSYAPLFHTYFDLMLR